MTEKKYPKYRVVAVDKAAKKRGDAPENTYVSVGALWDSPVGLSLSWDRRTAEDVLERVFQNRGNYFWNAYVFTPRNNDDEASF